MCSVDIIRYIYIYELVDIIYITPLSHTRQQLGIRTGTNNHEGIQDPRQDTHAKQLPDIPIQTD